MEPTTLGRLPIDGEAVPIESSKVAVTPLLTVGRVINVHQQILLTHTGLRGICTVVLTYPTGGLWEAIWSIGISSSGST